MIGDISNEEAVALLDAIDASDPEVAHNTADSILRWTVDRSARQALRRLEDRSEWWGCA